MALRFFALGVGIGLGVIVALVALMLVADILDSRNEKKQWKDLDSPASPPKHKKLTEKEIKKAVKSMSQVVRDTE